MPQSVDDQHPVADDSSPAGTLPKALPISPSPKDPSPSGQSDSTANADQGAGGAPSADGSLEAKDRDGIEKAWIEKAKKLVERTKDDPYMQERAVSNLQADYVKKRFDKDLKIPREEES